MKTLFFACVIVLSSAGALAQADANPPSVNLTREQAWERMKQHQEEFYQMLLQRSPSMAERFRERILIRTQNQPPALSPELDARYREHLQRYDTNRNGRIDLEESSLATSIPRIGTEKELMSRGLTRQEAAKAIRENAFLQAQDRRNRMRTRFVAESIGSEVIKRYDLNKDGILDEAEHKNFKMALNKETWLKSPEGLRRYDTDLDGVINDAEMQKYDEDELAVKQEEARQEEERARITKQNEKIQAEAARLIRFKGGEGAAELLISSIFKDRRPFPNLLRALKDSDKPALIQEFQRQPLTNKIHAIWALAYLGGPDVREVYQKVLEDNYQSQPLDAEQMNAMIEIAFGMGLLAKDDPLAYYFLVDRMKPEFWSGLRKWTLNEKGINDRFLDGRLAGAMIKGIGISGRDEAPQLLDSILSWDGHVLDQVGGELVEANYYLSKTKTMDRKTMVISMGASNFDDFVKWSETEDGKNWNRWFRGRH